MKDEEARKILGDILKIYGYTWKAKKAVKDGVDSNLYRAQRLLICELYGDDEDLDRYFSEFPDHVNDCCGPETLDARGLLGELTRLFDYAGRLEGSVLQMEVSGAIEDAMVHAASG